MIKEIKKRLANGETVVLECIDESGYDRIKEGLITFDDISVDDLKHFKIKEYKGKYSHTEAFTIGSIEDLLKIDKGDEIHLLNGEVLEASGIKDGNRIGYYTFSEDNGFHVEYAEFVFLRGSKVVKNRCISTNIFDEFLDTLFKAIKEGKATACHVNNSYARWYINSCETDEFMSCKEEYDEEIQSYIDMLKESMSNE